MKKEVLLDMIEKLTGKPVNIPAKDKSSVDTLLNRFISKRSLVLNWNEFNEILLLCNKDRMSKGFFDFFLNQSTPKKDKLTLAEIKKGVENFRIYAMLVFGNFIFAYRTLSKNTFKEIECALKPLLKNSKEIEKDLKKRPQALEKIYTIDRKDTHFVGYLSGKIIEVEYNSALLLQNFIKSYKGKNFDKELNEFLHINSADKAIKDNIIQIISKFYKCNPSASILKFGKFLSKSLKTLTKVKERYEQVREKAVLNTSIYLTWDYLDVYLATSMREKYEFEAVYDFASDLFNRPMLKNINVRYFDPTQSFEKNRIDKGLIEGLMLKRAKCTIYSIQESDTIGKDSELAATLAQGKAVIAYIPKIKIETHLKLIKKQPLSFIRNKIDLLRNEFRKPEVINSLRKWLKKNSYKDVEIDMDDPLSFNRFIFEVSNKILKIISKNIWDSIEITEQQQHKQKQELGNAFDVICYFIAVADEHFYDYRASILQKSHPLGIQINLSNGVANGVLVVRNVDNCAQLLYNILTNRLRQNLFMGYDSEMNYYFLKEKVSDSIYRVVTNDRKLTNSFWNFYLIEEEV